MLNKICTMTAKSAPYPPCTVTIFWLKYQDPVRCCRRVTQPPHIAGPLGFIAVANQYPVHLRKFIMTFNFRPHTVTQSSPNFILTCPACPTLLANNNSRFCFLKYTKPAHEHYLQVLPTLLKPASPPSTGT
jgi:hypothetical protein